MAHTVTPFARTIKRIVANTSIWKKTLAFNPCLLLSIFRACIHSISRENFFRLSLFLSFSNCPDEQGSSHGCCFLIVQQETAATATFPVFHVWTFCKDSKKNEQVKYQKWDRCFIITSVVGATWQDLELTQDAGDCRAEVRVLPDLARKDQAHWSGEKFLSFALANVIHFGDPNK